MGCNALGPPLMMKDFNLEPQGNTYEITIGVHDKIIITLQHEETGIEITSKVTPAIKAASTSEVGKFEFEAEYFVHQLSSKVKKPKKKK